MSTTKKATGRPKKAAPTVQKVKSFTIKQNIQEKKQTVFEITNGGGIICRIKSEFTTYDAERGGIVSVRYCPNEPSIYTDEQSDYAKREHVVFRDKFLAVNYDKPNLLLFLEKHPDNVANGGDLFRVIDQGATAEEELEKEFSQFEAVGMVRDKDIDELLPVAMYLGINIDQKSAQIRRELLKDAKSNPTRFVSLFDNPQVKCRSAVVQGVKFQILNSRPDGMYWFDNNRLIVTTPAGMDSTDVTTRFFLTEKGSTAYDALLEQLSKL